MKNQLTTEQLGTIIAEDLVELAKNQKYNELRATGMMIANEHADLAYRFGCYKRKSIGNTIVFAAGCSAIAFILGYAKCIVDNKKEENEQNS